MNGTLSESGRRLRSVAVLGLLWGTLGTGLDVLHPMVVRAEGTTRDNAGDSAAISVAAAGAVEQPAEATLPLNYGRVCEPQVPPAFRPLPLGSVEPAGWLRDWAVAARVGITGHLDEDHAVFGDAWKGFHPPGPVRLHQVPDFDVPRDARGSTVARLGPANQ